MKPCVEEPVEAVSDDEEEVYLNKVEAGWREME